jgi:excisionase family DNA binding protein
MPTTEDMLPLLRPVDVAELLNVSRKTAYRLIERGELSAVYVGTSVRIRPEELAEYVERGGHR